MTTENIRGKSKSKCIKTFSLDKHQKVRGATEKKKPNQEKVASPNHQE